MNRTYRICLYSMIGILLLAAVFAGSYYYALYLQQDNDTEPEAAPVDASTVQIQADTDIVIESYYELEDVTDIVTIKPDATYLGMTQEALVNYLKHIEEATEGEFFETGLLKASLESFSSARVSIYMEYYSNEMSGMYVLQEEDDFVNVVRLSDMEVYAQTAIRVSELPEDTAARIGGGKYFLDITEVYDFLETYSS